MRGTPDNLYTHDLYSAIVDETPPNLRCMCFGTLFSYKHIKLSEQKYVLVILLFETPHLPKISHVSNSRHNPNGRLMKNY